MHNPMVVAKINQKTLKLLTSNGFVTTILSKFGSHSFNTYFNTKVCYGRGYT